jgi:23S rRNA pseudouridine1911/1915/1917 synthase
VHLESISRHIIGDHVYALSSKLEKSEHILLHAYLIYFIHPSTKERVFFQAPLDDVMQEYLEKKFEKERLDEVLEPDSLIHGFIGAY